MTTATVLAGAVTEWAARCIRFSCPHETGRGAVIYPRRDRREVERFIASYPGSYELVSRQRLHTDWEACQ